MCVEADQYWPFLASAMKSPSAYFPGFSLDQVQSLRTGQPRECHRGLVGLFNGLAKLVHFFLDQPLEVKY
jgi:hypothetical protein